MTKKHCMLIRPDGTIHFFDDPEALESSEDLFAACKSANGITFWASHSHQSPSRMPAHNPVAMGLVSLLGVEVGNLLGPVSLTRDGGLTPDDLRDISEFRESLERSGWGRSRANLVGEAYRFGLAVRKDHRLCEAKPKPKGQG